MKKRNRMAAVLVPEVHAVGAIGVVRSLGRAGYIVHAMSSTKNALGFLSKFSMHIALAPPYSSEDFLPWLRDYVNVNSIDAIIPSDGLMLAIKPVFEEFQSLITVQSKKDDLFRCYSKYDVFKSFFTPAASKELLNNIPETFFVENGRDFSAVEIIGFDKPYFLKADASHSKKQLPSIVEQVYTLDVLEKKIDKLKDDYDKILIQGYAPGKDVGAYLFVWNNQVVAEFMNIALHSVPHTGGFYSLRENFVHQQIRDDALKRINHLKWQGVAMMEYRWDQLTGKFYFIEINARFWGSLHHALYSGVDFPLLLLKVFTNSYSFQNNVIKTGRKSIKCRYTFPMEVGYVVSCLKDTNYSLMDKLKISIEFFTLFFYKSIYSDLYFPEDEKLYFESIKRTIIQFLNL